MKKLIWLGRSYEHLKKFPETARRLAGRQLNILQLGQEPFDWKPISTIGIGAQEIRVHAPSEYRVIYVAKFSEGIYVLHAFEKKTQKTLCREIQIAKAAYAKIKQTK